MCRHGVSYPVSHQKNRQIKHFFASDGSTENNKGRFQRTTNEHLSETDRGHRNFSKNTQTVGSKDANACGTPTNLHFGDSRHIYTGLSRGGGVGRCASHDLQELRPFASSYFFHDLETPDLGTVQVLLPEQRSEGEHGDGTAGSPHGTPLRTCFLVSNFYGYFYRDKPIKDSLKSHFPQTVKISGENN